MNNDGDIDLFSKEVTLININEAGDLLLLLKAKGTFLVCNKAPGVLYSKEQLDSVEFFTKGGWALANKVLTSNTKTDEPKDKYHSRYNGKLKTITLTLEDPRNTIMLGTIEHLEMWEVYKVKDFSKFYKKFTLPDFNDDIYQEYLDLSHETIKFILSNKLYDIYFNLNNGEFPHSKYTKQIDTLLSSDEFRGYCEDEDRKAKANTVRELDRINSETNQNSK